MAQKFGMTWWGEQWLQALTRIDYSNRLPRGASYARKGAVLSIKVTGNRIAAKVQGSRRKPYDITITVPQFDKKKIDKLTDGILENPTLLAQLLNRELNPQIMELAQRIGLRIFPASWKDLEMHCSCPDWAVPCKHLAAVIYMMSREIDNNPFLVFDLHGVDFQRELERRGITLDTCSDMSVQEWLSVFKVAEKQTDAKTEKEFQRVDFSHLTDISGPLCNLLAPNPPFYPSSDFQKLYHAQINRCSRQAERLLAGRKSLAEITGTTQKTVLKSDSLHFAVEDNGHISVSLTRSDQFYDAAVPDENDLPGSILAIPADYLADYDLSIASLHQILMAAIHMIRNGCVIPQILSLPKEKHIIRWLPAMLDKEVKIVVQSLAHIMPEDILIRPAHGRKKAAAVENAAEHLLSWAVTWLMSRMSETAFNDKTSGMFFLGQSNSFTDVGEKEIPGGIKAWIERLHISSGQYRPTLIIDEAGKGFTLNVSVTISGKEVPLQNILSQKKYEAERFSVLKELSLLSPFVKDLDRYINSKAKEPVGFTLDTFTPFLTDIIPAVRLLGIRVVLPKELQELIRPKVSIKISKKITKEAGHLRLDDLLAFDWQVALGDNLLSEQEFMKLVRNAKGLIRFKNKYIYLHEDDLTRLRNVFEKGMTLSPDQLLQAALSESYDMAPVKLDDEVRKLIKELTEQTEVPVPNEINATLRPYQKRGYAWMYRNMRIGFGSILADDMGLGKTLQVITLLQKLKNDGLLTPKNAAAVVVPTGLITNWQEEIVRFAPSLKVFTYHGPQRDIKAFKADILLTTYGVMRSDIALLKKRQWQVVVIDEAQNIKNAETAQSKAARSLQAATHIAMSGTPVENRLSEFWSVMDFANKGYLGNIQSFQNNFSHPIQNYGDKEKAYLFRKVTAPFLMRRLKTDRSIINDLPDKIEQDETVHLTSSQASLYEQTLHEAMVQIECIEGADNKSLFKRQGLILQMILALKQICNHPALFLKNGKFEPELSGKTMLLLDLLGSIVESNQKVLVFTQFKEMGEMLEQMIAQHLGERPLFLHGGCSVKQRKELVDRFQQSKGDHIFLLSLKAAGTGLNLTAASNVIHYDLWWNPAVEAQATDRAFRIGQHQNVMVHRFITHDTFEERINDMIQRKKKLAEMTVSTGESWIGKLSNKELHEIFEREEK